MPTDNGKFKQATLVAKAVEIREKHMRLKDLVHGKNIHRQTVVPPRKQLISWGSVYTKAKDHSIKLYKKKEKKDAKSENKGTSSKMRIVRIDATLSKFLRTRERGFSEVDMYQDTLVTSYFTDWVVRNGLQNGKEVKLNQEFISLFGEDLKKLGTGPTKIDSNGTEVKTAVLDPSGNQINPLNMNKHMTVFAFHYPQKTKTVNGRTTTGREVIAKDEYPRVYEEIKKEHTLMTIDLKQARNAYKKAQTLVRDLGERKKVAPKYGDRSIDDDMRNAEDSLKRAKTEYVRILNANRLPHTLQ